MMIARFLAAATAKLITAMAWVVTGVTANWQGCTPSASPRVYFANHGSHGDFVLIWSVLPALLRRRTRPVAGADYWQRDWVRRYIGASVFNALLIERDRTGRSTDPVQQMTDVLQAGSSLILFPEGTRNTTDERLLPFRGGLYHLARRCPEVEFVPVWIEHLNRVLPKGEVIPVPLLCTVTFGAPIRLLPGEEKSAFLDRARDGLLALGTRYSERHV
ncbi:lysophospholipid acyltransferase family protein [Fodinicurvata sp. EGI_FJ10296]|uniref:lysophospholipid acyltransferase family protein n=1 Tax=Fodinicurvata sp. EGI_FJ10296 TaxID=3231908 RepID=UPI003453F841